MGDIMSCRTGGKLEEVYLISQPVVNEVEELILKEVSNGPVSVDELLSASLLIDKIGMIDYSVIPSALKNLPYMDLPKKMLIKTVIESLINKRLIARDSEGQLRLAPRGIRYLTGNPNIIEIAKVVPKNGVFILSPLPFSMYELVVSIDLPDNCEGVYVVSSKYDIGVLERLIPIAKEDIDKKRATVRVLLLKNTTVLKRGEEVIELSKIA